MPNGKKVPIVGGGPAGMSCALWLCNYGLKPILIEAEPALGGMARRSPYPNEGLLGRPGETARENAAAFARHIGRLPIEVRLAAKPLALHRPGDGQFHLEVASADVSGAQAIDCAALVLATGTRFAGDEWLDGVANARLLMEQGRVHVGAPWAREIQCALTGYKSMVLRPSEEEVATGREKSGVARQLRSPARAPGASPAGSREAVPARAGSPRRRA